MTNHSKEHAAIIEATQQYAIDKKRREQMNLNPQSRVGCPVKSVFKLVRTARSRGFLFVQTHLNQLDRRTTQAQVDQAIIAAASLLLEICEIDHPIPLKSLVDGSELKNDAQDLLSASFSMDSKYLKEYPEADGSVQWINMGPEVA